MSDRLPTDSNLRAALRRLREYIASDDPDADDTILDMGISGFVLDAINDACHLDAHNLLATQAVEIIMELCILHERACHHRDKIRNTLWDQVVQARDPNRNPYNQPPYRNNAGESL